jgi:hypothetical protein
MDDTHPNVSYSQGFIPGSSNLSPEYYNNTYQLGRRSLTFYISHTIHSWTRSRNATAAVSFYGMSFHLP